MINFKRKDDIVTDMITYAVSHGCPVTDFNTGSVFRSLFEAVAWVISDYSGLVRVDWETALKDFIYRVFSFSRKSGTAAGTVLVFTAGAPVSADVTIPAGSRAKTADGTIFETLVDGTILNGQVSSSPVNATASVVGVGGNVPIGAINTLVSNLLYVVAVTNTLPATGGTEGETDAEYQARFSIFVSNLARSTINGYKTGALSVTGVKYAYVLEELGTYAETKLVFSATTPPVADITIPAGTRVKTAAEVWFITLADAIIPAGLLVSGEVDAQAINRGSTSNVPLGSIVLIVDAVTGVTGVTNTVAATGGTDGTLGRVNLYVDDGSGGVTADVMTEVIKVIEGDPADRANYPGYRAAGTVISYREPTILNVDVVQTIYTSEGVDRTAVKADVEAAQIVYLNGLEMGANVIAARLKSAALSVQGVVDVVVTTPAGNIDVAFDNVAKASSFTTQVVGYVD